MHVFNVNIEFDHDVFRHKVEHCIETGEKGYVCVIDGNILTIAHKDLQFRNIVNKAIVNTCDGSSIALMCNKIYGTEYSAYNGPSIFEYYIEKSISQVLIGNTEETVDKIREIVTSKIGHCDLQHIALPFADVDTFDYIDISKRINEIKPQIIWISLGAPKQEMFMDRLLPHINSGIMIGIGAAFNYYIGAIDEPKAHIGKLKFVWLKRLFEEPKKQWKRCWKSITAYPAIYKEESNKKRSNF